jgi:hypothetical protein
MVLQTNKEEGFLCLYAVPSHNSRIVRLIFIKCYVGGPCSSAPHAYAIYRAASKVGIPELKIERQYQGERTRIVMSAYISEESLLFCTDIVDITRVLKFLIVSFRFY